MTVEALSIILCLVSGIFGRPAWDVKMCDDRAEQILSVSQKYEVDPLMLVSVNIQECDLRESIQVKFYPKGETSKKKKAIGVDACPMGIRIWWPSGKSPAQGPSAEDLYEIAGRKMAHWKGWCERNHRGRQHHHYIGHWNEGNPIYATQVLAFRQILLGRRPKSDQLLTTRTKEIIRRLRAAQIQESKNKNQRS